MSVPISIIEGETTYRQGTCLLNVGGTSTNVRWDNMWHNDSSQNCHDNLSIILILLS